MPRNTSQQQAIAHRRERVATLRLRGLTQRAIAMQLKKEGIVNPGSGRPYSLGTINADIATLDERWRQAALADTSLLKGRVLAEVREVRYEAWTRKDLPTVQRGLKQEIDLLGLQGPTASKLGEHVSDSSHAPLPVSEGDPGALAALLQEVSLSFPEQITALLDDYNDLKAHTEAFNSRLQALKRGTGPRSQTNHSDPPIDMEE